jgi:hypothetical protein
MGDLEEPIVLGEGGQRVRLDPNTNLRFTFKDGTRSPWLVASGLETGAETARVGERRAWIQGVVIEDLAADDAVALLRLAGARATAEKSGRVHLDVSGEALRVLARRFSLDVALRHAPAFSSVEVQCPFGQVDANAVDEHRCYETREEQALRHLAVAHRFAPLGRWYYALDDGTLYGPHPPQADESIFAFGVVRSYGFHWRDVVSAEAENFSGSKTLAYIGANAALAVVLAPLMLLGSFDLPGIGTAPATAATAVAEAAPNPTRDAEPTPLSSVHVPAAVSAPAHALFRDRASRRAIVQAIGAVGSSAHARLDDGVALSAYGGARLYDVFEAGLGLSRFERGAYALSFRTGGHFHLDGDHFFAIPLFVEAGAGPGVDSYFRLGYGARARFARRAFAGVYVFNPTYVNLDRGRPDWRFSHGFELGLSF